MKELIEKTMAYVKDKAGNETTGHDFHHAIRVYNMAVYLSIGYDVDEEVVSLAALLHDLDDPKVADENSKLTLEFLNENVDGQVKNQVMDIITNMSFSSYKKGKVMTSLEGKIVQDADRLDALGAVGIARCFAYSGKTNRMIYDYSIDDDSAIAHFYQKLFTLDSLMNTVEARNIAEKRIDFMKNYLREFFKEWQ